MQTVQVEIVIVLLESFLLKKKVVISFIKQWIEALKIHTNVSNIQKISYTGQWIITQYLHPEIC